MIAKLTGTVDSSGQSWLVLDVGGVGYLVHCSTRTVAQVEGQYAQGQHTPVSLLIHTLVREYNHQLYGFLDPLERVWFRLLLNVQGVGGRVALALLSAFMANELGQIIGQRDHAALRRGEGVGPKLAARIIAELEDKARPLTTEMPTAGPRQDLEDAILALARMGYRTTEAKRALQKVRQQYGEGQSISDLVRQALQELYPSEDSW